MRTARPEVMPCSVKKSMILRTSFCSCQLSRIRLSRSCADALDMEKGIRGFLKDVEGAFVINGDDCGGQFRPDAADRTRGQILLDPFSRGRMRRFEFVGLELLAVLGINDPAAAGLNMLARRNRRSCCRRP